MFDECVASSLTYFVATELRNSLMYSVSAELVTSVREIRFFSLAKVSSSKLYMSSFHIYERVKVMIALVSINLLIRKGKTHLGHRRD